MTLTSSSQTTNPMDELALASFEDLQAKRVEWLWPNWVPLGKLALLDGDPGLGKSTLLLDLAARVSTSGVMPDGSQGVGGNVILLSAEDDPKDTIKPRLAAAQADQKRIFWLDVIGQESDARPVQIPGDLPFLRRLIAKHDARLLIVDPLMAFLAGVDANRDQDVRRALYQLSIVAGQHRCAVICVRHLNKRDTGKAIYRGNSSIGVIGHARAGLLLAQDPDDDGQRVLAVSKCNITLKPDSLRFALEDQGEACRIDWRGESPYHADHLVERSLTAEQKERAKSARQKEHNCQRFLHDLLKNGKEAAKKAKEACENAGFSRRTAERAAQKLKVVLTRGANMNYWSLPNRDEKAAV